jgi:hypothetical protein
MYEEIIDFAYDTPDGYDGWTLLMDVTRVPSKAIDWLGQFVGVKPVEGLTDTQKIQRIIAREGFSRGTPAGMKAAAAIFLTGTKSVILYERDTSPYHMSVQTYRSETPVEDWPATNTVFNGGFEVDTTGRTTINDMTITRDTSQAKYGAASGRLTITGVSNPYVYPGFVGISGATAGRVFTHTMWIYGAGSMIGKTWLIGVQEQGGAFGASEQTTTSFTIVAGWQKVTVTRTIIRNDRTSIAGYLQATSTPVIGNTMWLDGVQFEENPAATPYIETSAGSASRAVGQGPVGAALRSQKPAGIVMIYNVIAGQIYQQLKTGHSPYSAMKAYYTTYDKVRSDTP